MARQISTSVSDFVLACSVFYVVFHLLQHSLLFAAAGLSLQGIAASAGVIRFASKRSEMGTMFRVHKFLSWLAAAAGVPLLSYEFCQTYSAFTTGYGLASFSGMVTLTSQFQNAENKQLFTQASSGLGMLIVLVLCVSNFNVNGIMAALTYILTGAIIGSEGSIMGMLRIDILHYGLVIGNVFFLWALI